MNEIVTITIGKDEAIILFELLVDFFDEPSVIVCDNADRMALSGLAGVLEETLAEPFMESYGEVADGARKRLVEKWGEGLREVSDDKARR
jgi:hypothetical protein